MPTVATAGHVDHGKSTLVRALTGTDPDRLAEERRRGLTLDLGFADCVLPSGRHLGLVDVPGHERYLTNLLAGVGAVTACLFVVAADRGWRAQSEEHLVVLELLGVGHAVVALTRCDLAAASAAATARAAVRERFARSPVDLVDVVDVDARHGEGVDAVAGALDRALDAAGPAPDVGRPRLWVDRSFAVPGAGTVVTGTLGGGSLAEGDVVEVGGRRARVRGLQRHGVPAERVGPGERAAVNLAGVPHRSVGRGDAVVRPGDWHPTTSVDATLHVVGSLAHPVSRRGAWSLHVGSAHLPVRLVVPTGTVAPGAAAVVRIHLSGPLPLVVGDRGVLRESGRGEVVGGVAVVDVAPVLPAGRTTADGTVARLVADRGAVAVEDLWRWTGRRVAPEVGRFAVAPEELDRRRGRLAEGLAAAGDGLDVTELDELDRAVAATFPGVVVAAGRVRAADGPGPDPAVAVWLDLLGREPTAGHPPGDLGRDQLRRLSVTGQVVRLDGVWFSRAGLDALVAELARMPSLRGDGAGIGDVRAALGGSRRTIVPFLTWCDEHGLTRRRGDVRIAGPRLHRPAARRAAGDPAPDR